MKCRECVEISEAYLSDELLVETNMQFFRHLEDCKDCRADFASRRELRRRMISSVRTSSEFAIDPGFERRLTAGLKSSFDGGGRTSFFSRPKILIPTLVGALMFAFLGLAIMNPSVNNAWHSLSEKPGIDGVAGLLASVVGHHQSCAVAKLRIWEQSSRDVDSEARYAETILAPLRQNFSPEVQLLHTDDCLFEGSPFVHVILKDGPRVLSVFYAKQDLAAGESRTVADLIVTDEENGFQVAAFQKDMQTVFVVSDLPETENLGVARTLFNAWRQV